jgi:hypothetical protein
MARAVETRFQSLAYALLKFPGAISEPEITPRPWRQTRAAGWLVFRDRAPYQIRPPASEFGQNVWNSYILQLWVLNSLPRGC